LVRVSSDREGSTTTYEFSGRQRSGCHLEIDVIAPRQLEEIEIQLPNFTQVPERARRAVNRRLPNFEPSYVEESRRPQANGGFAVFYEIEGTSKGQGYEATVDANGTSVEVERLDEGS
ncbi:MAG TPA: hypothetical protein V6D03_14585, partial [Candidatus Caenarcaniphilales bacterium]